MIITPGRSIKYIFLSHLSAGILILLYFLLFAEKLSIAVLNPPHLLVNMLLSYSALFLPVTAGSLFFAMLLADTASGRKISGRFPAGTGMQGESGRQLVVTAILASIPSALLYMLMVFYAEPRLISKKEWLEQLSESGSLYIREAEEAFAAEEYEKSLAYANLYLYIDPQNKRALEIINDLKIVIPPETTPEMQEGSDFSLIKAGDYFTGEKLLKISENFLEKGDYPSALYYAGMARNFGADKRKVSAIINEAEKRFSVFLPEKSAMEKLFDGKVSVRRYMQDKEFHSAYYLFHQLQQEFPRDTELSGMGEELFRELSSVSFFYEEIQGINMAPGKKGISFINSTENRGERQLVLAEKVVFAGNTAYFFDVDIIDLSAEGTIDRHIYSMYGKLIGQSLNMQCMGRETRQLFLPAVISGDRDRAASAIELELPAEALLYMGREESRLKKVKTSFLADNLALFTSSGAGTASPGQELFSRFIRFFNLIFVQLLVIPAAISFLKRRKSKSYFSLLLLPLAVFLVYILENSIITIKSGIVTILIWKGGTGAAAVAYTAITLAEIGAAAAYAAKKTTSLFRGEENSSH